MVNLLLVDDHEVIRSGIKTIIRQYIPHSVVDEAHDGDSGFEKIKNKDYDIILLDINMPNTDSFSLVSNILAFKPGSRILIFSMNDENIYAEKYIKMGAMGYLRKDEPGDTIIKAITGILDNRPFMSDSLKEKLISNIQGKKLCENPFDKLSPREFEIVQHLACGHPLSHISQTLNLHTSTVGTHKARIFQKLNCNNIIELNTLAKVHNIIFQ